MRFLLPIAGLFIVFCPPPVDADLSGDFRITIKDQKGSETGQLGKIYLQGEPDSPERAVRMELRPEGEAAEMVFLSKPQDRTMFMVMPEAKTYFKMKMEEGKTPQAPGEGHGLKPSDFKTVGRGKVGSFSTVIKEARLRSSDGTSSSTVRIHVAPGLNDEPIKSIVQQDNGSTTTAVIENPTTTDIPDDRFRVPADYKQAKLPSMSKMLESFGAGAKDEAQHEAEQEAAEQKEKAKQGAKDSIKKKLLPF